MQIIRKIYDWTLRQARTPYAEWTLFGVSFAESSCFPLPPDVLLLPMCIAERTKALRFALICTIGSVLGGLLGYAIGALLYETVGLWIINTYHLQSAFENFNRTFNEWGVLFILVKGLIFIIPFKLVTIACGVAHLNLLHFVLATTVIRASRFYLVAWLVMKYGEQITPFIEKYLNWIALSILPLIVLGFWLVL